MGALLALPLASAAGASLTETREGECGSTALLVDAGKARVDAEGRSRCGEDAGDYVNVVVTEPQGRLFLVWERQEGNQSYSELAVAHPPRVLVWHADEYGCWMSVGVAGTRDYDCPAGPPPPPPRVGWGRMLP